MELFLIIVAEILFVLFIRTLIGLGGVGGMTAKVKFLEWSVGEANTPFGWYMTAVENEGMWSFTFHQYPRGEPDETLYFTEESAQAAAQLDYESRILYALEGKS